MATFGWFTSGYFRPRSAAGIENIFSETCDARALPLVGCRGESVWEVGAGGGQVAGVLPVKPPDMLHPGTDSSSSRSTTQDVGCGHLLAARWRPRTSPNKSRGTVIGAGVCGNVHPCARGSAAVPVVPTGYFASVRGGHGIWGEKPSTGCELGKTRRCGHCGAAARHQQKFGDGWCVCNLGTLPSQHEVVSRLERHLRVINM